MSSRTLAACIATALVGTAGVAAAADGQSGRSLELTMSAPAHRDVNQVDVGRRGMSVGDEFVGAGTLRSGGKVAGRAHSICTLVDASYRGQDCRITLLLRDGQLTAEGGGLDKPLPGVGDGSPGTGDPFGITGGTGAYEGAAGTLVIRQAKGGASRLTVTLR